MSMSFRWGAEGLYVRYQDRWYRVRLLRGQLADLESGWKDDDLGNWGEPWPVKNELVPTGAGLPLRPACQSGPLAASALNSLIISVPTVVTTRKRFYSPFSVIFYLT